MPPLPRHSGGRARAVVLALLTCALAMPGLARDWGGTLYRWRDGAGAVRYTTHPERVPGEYRETLREVRASDEPPAEADAAAGAPGPQGSPGTGGEFGGDLATSAAGAAGAPPGAPGTGGSPAGGPGAPATAATTAPEPTPLDLEIEALAAEVARDEEVLKTLISDPDAASELTRYSDLSSIAQRLPERQAALRALRAERDRVGNPAAEGGRGGG